MKHVPPSVSAALKRRGRDDILQQDGEYEQYKSQIAQIIHGDDALQSDSEDYENDIEPSSTPEEAKANKVIEGYGEKYADNNKETKESKTQRWNEIFNKMGLDDDEVFRVLDDYAFYEGFFDDDKLVKELGYEDVQDLTNEDIINAIDDEDMVKIIKNAGYLDEYEKATSDDAKDEEDSERDYEDQDDDNTAKPSKDAVAVFKEDEKYGGNLFSIVKNQKEKYDIIKNDATHDDTLTTRSYDTPQEAISELKRLRNSVSQISEEDSDKGVSTIGQLRQTLHDIPHFNEMSNEEIQKIIDAIKGK